MYIDKKKAIFIPYIKGLTERLEVAKHIFLILGTMEFFKDV